MEMGLDEESRSKVRVEKKRSLNQSAAERRRRILERGSHRLDLITGKIPSLSPHHSGEATGPRNDETPPSTLPKLDTSSADYSMGGDAVEMDRETLPNPTVEDRSDTQPLLVMPVIQEASTDAKPLGEPHRSCWPKLFSHKQISHCILASEKTRACCALIIALLVVLSYIDDVLFGVDIVSSENVIASRPLYLVLLTDVTIVLAWLLLAKERNLRQLPEQERDEGQGNGDIWTDAVHLLESGLVIYRIMRALFIDCSVYLVVVVSGVSLV